MKSRVKAILIEIIRNSQGEEPDIEITEQTTLREELGLDSFNLAELTVHIEEEFDIDIFEDGIISTVGEIYEKLK